MLAKEVFKASSYFVSKNRKGLLPCIECGRSTPNSMLVGVVWLEPLCEDHNLPAMIFKHFPRDLITLDQPLPNPGLTQESALGSL